MCSGVTVADALCEVKRMNDLISRQETIEKLDFYMQSTLSDLECEMREDEMDFYKACHLAKKIITNMPCAQPERKKGKWIDGFCSECHQEAITEWNDRGGEYALTRYCPYCGAKMEE